MIEFAYTTFLLAIIESCSLIICSELGDKTFFTVALMSSKNNALHIFFSATIALILMTVLSAAMGMLLFKYIPPSITHWVSIALYIFFGIRLLIEAFQDKSEEEKEIPFTRLPLEDLEDSEMVIVDIPRVVGGKNCSPVHCDSPSTQAETVMLAEEEDNPPRAYQNYGRLSFLGNKIPPIVSKCFFLILMAEWGDRSQIATLSIAATKNWIAVSIGASLGHTFCTIIAVMGGKYAAIVASERILSFCGGFLFLLFGIIGIFT